MEVVFQKGIPTNGIILGETFGIAIKDEVTSKKIRKAIFALKQ